MSGMLFSAYQHNRRLAHGTMEQLVETLGLSETTLRAYMTPSHVNYATSRTLIVRNHSRIGTHRRPRRHGEYAVYKGDRLLFIEDFETCCARLGVKPSTFRYYATPTYRERVASRKNSIDALHVVHIPERDPRDIVFAENGIPLIHEPERVPLYL